MKFIAILFLALTCWLLYERVGLAKEVAAANARLTEMDELQKRFEMAQSEITRLRGRAPTKEDTWFKDALKPKLK
jgi:type II secretory pathway component PulM